MVFIHNHLPIWLKKNTQTCVYVWVSGPIKNFLNLSVSAIPRANLFSVCCHAVGGAIHLQVGLQIAYKRKRSSNVRAEPMRSVPHTFKFLCFAYLMHKFLTHCLKVTYLWFIFICHQTIWDVVAVTCCYGFRLASDLTDRYRKLHAF